MEPMDSDEDVPESGLHDQRTCTSEGQSLGGASEDDNEHAGTSTEYSLDNLEEEELELAGCSDESGASDLDDIPEADDEF